MDGPLPSAASLYPAFGEVLFADAGGRKQLERETANRNRLSGAIYLVIQNVCGAEGAMHWLEKLRMRLRMLVHREQEKRRLDAELF